MAHIQGFIGKVPMLTEIAIVVVMAWMVAGMLMPAEQISAIDKPQQSLSSVMTLPALTDLLAVPLFGQLPAQDMPKSQTKVQPKTVVQSPLNIKLLGTVVAGDDSAAIIRLAGGAGEKGFFIGDAIQPGATLKEVASWSIIVDHNGRLEKISMTKGMALPQAASPVVVNAPARIQQHAMSRVQLNRHMQNLPSLLSEARALPNMVNGRMDGFVITDIVDGSLYQQAGLQNGDVLRKVNGQVISNAGQAMQLYQTLQSATGIDIELTRAGQLQQLHYDIR